MLLDCIPGAGRRPKRRRRASEVPRHQVEIVCELRGEHPARSKHRMAVILARERGITLSASTAGRIIERKGPCSERASRRRRRAAGRRRKRLRPARWTKRAFPGCPIQVDVKHLKSCGKRFCKFASEIVTWATFTEISLDSCGKRSCHLTAMDRFSRISFSRAYPSAGSLPARDLPSRLPSFLPFSLWAVQTDGGAEFLRHFSSAAEEREISRFSSHPRCPGGNAFVEGKIQTTDCEPRAFREGYTFEG